MLIKAVQQITGQKPRNLELYLLAMKHSSVDSGSLSGVRTSNERLEYLGDAVLGAIVAEYLFKKYPFKDEGFLTEIRSRIVNRDSMNQLAINIGLSNLIEFDAKRKTALSHKSLYGDAMEAFIGAYYLDMGFQACQKFIISKLLKHHYDLDEVVETTTNFKSKLIEWAQRNDKSVTFTVDVQPGSKQHAKQFKAQVFMDEEVIGEGMGFSKKKAQQDAARRACEALNIE
jgi:ribonuclease-3